jgi:hypothetical protein
VGLLTPITERSSVNFNDEGQFCKGSACCIADLKGFLFKVYGAQFFVYLPESELA